MTEDKTVGWHHQLNGHELNSRRWWRTGRPGMLQSMGSQRAGHDWVTEQQKGSIKNKGRKKIHSQAQGTIIALRHQVLQHNEWKKIHTKLPYHEVWAHIIKILKLPDRTLAKVQELKNHSLLQTIRESSLAYESKEEKCLFRIISYFKLEFQSTDKTSV